jgi:hypothetical protein
MSGADAQGTSSAIDEEDQNAQDPLKQTQLQIMTCATRGAFRMQCIAQKSQNCRAMMRRAWQACVGALQKHVPKKLYVFRVQAFVCSIRLRQPMGRLPLRSRARDA